MRGRGEFLPFEVVENESGFAVELALGGGDAVGICADDADGSNAIPLLNIDAIRQTQR